MKLYMFSGHFSLPCHFNEKPSNGNSGNKKTPYSKCRVHPLARIKGLWLYLMRQIRLKWQGLRYWNFKQWISLYFYHTWNQSKYLLCIHGFLANISNRIITLTHRNLQHLSNFSLAYLQSSNCCFSLGKS